MISASARLTRLPVEERGITLADFLLPIRVGERNRLERDRIQDGEARRRGADAERKGDRHDDGEGRSAGQLPGGDTQFLQKGPHAMRRLSKQRATGFE